MANKKYKIVGYYRGNLLGYVFRVDYNQGSIEYCKSARSALTFPSLDYVCGEIDNLSRMTMNLPDGTGYWFIYE